MADGRYAIRMFRNKLGWRLGESLECGTRLAVTW